MAETKYPKLTHENLLNEALDLLHDVQNRLGMFEKQEYWKIRLKAESLKQEGIKEGQ